MPGCPERQIAGTRRQIQHPVMWLELGEFQQGMLPTTMKSDGHHVVGQVIAARDSSEE
jgi:hypothetical protein